MRILNSLMTVQVITCNQKQNSVYFVVLVNDFLCTLCME